MQTNKQARRLAHKMLAVYKEAEPTVKAAENRLKTTCSEGCASCCHLLTVITLPEALTIAEQLLTIPGGNQRLTYLMTKIYAQLAPLSEPDLTREGYFKKQLPCIFLSKDKTCEIYSHRPAACRYHAVVSDPKNCAIDAETPTISKIDFGKFEQEVWSEGSRVSKQVGMPFMMAPLPIALAWALRYLADGPEGLDEVAKSMSVMSPAYWIGLLASDTPLAQEILAAAKKQLVDASPQEEISEPGSP